MVSLAAHLQLQLGLGPGLGLGLGLDAVKREQDPGKALRQRAQLDWYFISCESQSESANVLAWKYGNYPNVEATRKSPVMECVIWEHLCDPCPSQKEDRGVLLATRHPSSRDAKTCDPINWASLH